MTPKSKARWSFVGLLVRLLAVSWVSMWLYFLLTDHLATWLVFLWSQFISDVASVPRWAPPVGLALEVFLGALVWWRVIKVFVFMGAPLALGVALSSGRQDQGDTGRLVVIAHVGSLDVYRTSYDGEFWYGGVFRANPRSDKLMRYRLELLLLGLPFLNRTLVIEESHFYLIKQEHKQRATYFRRRADRYRKRSSTMSEDRFRWELVQAMRRIKDHYVGEASRKTIDGLTWHLSLGGGGEITDYFGYGITFTAQEDGTYEVTGLGPDGADTQVVANVAELRELARKELHPVPGPPPADDTS